MDLEKLILWIFPSHPAVEEAILHQRRSVFCVRKKLWSTSHSWLMRTAFSCNSLIWYKSQARMWNQSSSIKSLGRLRFRWNIVTQGELASKHTNCKWWQSYCFKLKLRGWPSFGHLFYTLCICMVSCCSGVLFPREVSTLCKMSSPLEKLFNDSHPCTPVFSSFMSC